MLLLGWRAGVGVRLRWHGAAAAPLSHAPTVPSVGRTPSLRSTRLVVSAMALAAVVLVVVGRGHVVDVHGVEEAMRWS